MRLTDKDAVLKLCSKSGEGVVSYEEVEEKLPEIDAEIVTRCKDCKMWYVEWKREAGDCYCYKFLEWTDPDFFCAGGERREKNEVN